VLKSYSFLSKKMFSLSVSLCCLSLIGLRKLDLKNWVNFTFIEIESLRLTFLPFLSDAKIRSDKTALYKN